MVRAIACFFLTLPLLATAQGLRERALEQEKACESARVTYQTSCGHQIAPKYRSPACREAEVFIRQKC